MACPNLLNAAPTGLNISMIFAKTKNNPVCNEAPAPLSESVTPLNRFATST